MGDYSQNIFGCKYKSYTTKYIYKESKISLEINKNNGSNKESDIIGIPYLGDGILLGDEILSINKYKKIVNVDGGKYSFVILFNRKLLPKLYISKFENKALDSIKVEYEYF